MYSSSVFSSFGGFATPSASSLMSYKTDISYDTSSRDPAALRSRVFVGNLNTNRVTREDVIQMFKAYGTLAGVTLFKGYAFVQYSRPTEADLAVSALNGYNWNGSVLDVKLAAHGMKSSSSTVGLTTTKRGADISGTPKPKKTAIGSSAMEREVNNENKTFANGVTLPIMGIIEHVQNADTLICGECRFITSNVNDFIQHRKTHCQIFKAEGEPMKLQCFTCADEFISCWNLVKHLTSTHKMILYKDTSVEDAGVDASNGKLLTGPTGDEDGGLNDSPAVDENNIIGDVSNMPIATGEGGGLEDETIDD